MGLQRKTPLKTNPEKLKEWQQRSMRTYEENRKLNPPQNTLKQNSTLKSNSTLKKKPSKLKHRTDKGQQLEDEFQRLADLYLSKNPVCQYPNCKAKATDVHHSRGRTGTLYTDMKWFRGLCRTHHRWVHDNPKAALEIGLVFSRHRGGELDMEDDINA